MSPGGCAVHWAAITGELNRNHQWRGRPRKGTPGKRDLCSERPGLHPGIEVDRDRKQDPRLPQIQEKEHQDKPRRPNVLSLEESLFRRALLSSQEVKNRSQTDPVWAPPPISGRESLGPGRKTQTIRRGLASRKYSQMLGTQALSAKWCVLSLRSKAGMSPQRDILGTSDRS